MEGPFGQAAVFLIDTLFWLYILAVLLRFLLQVVHADFYNPFSQALVVITNPAVLPFRRVIPGLYGIDLASVVLLLVLQCLKNYLITLIRFGHSFKLLGLVVFSAAELLQLTIYVFIVAIFIRVILSWISPYGRYNPAIGVLIGLTEPLMLPARRLIPPIAGLDLSPIGVFILLYLTLILIVSPLLAFGQGLL